MGKVSRERAVAAQMLDSFSFEMKGLACAAVRLAEAIDKLDRKLAALEAEAQAGGVDLHADFRSGPPAAPPIAPGCVQSPAGLSARGTFLQDGL